MFICDGALYRKDDMKNCLFDKEVGSGKGNKGFMDPAFHELGNGRVSPIDNRLSTGSWSSGIGYVYHSTSGLVRSRKPLPASVQTMSTHGSLAFIAHISVVHGRHNRHITPHARHQSHCYFFTITITAKALIMKNACTDIL